MINGRKRQSGPDRQERYARLAETYHFHWMFYDVMAQPEMREMFQRRIDYDRWVRGKFKWPIPIRDLHSILPHPSEIQGDAENAKKCCSIRTVVVLCHMDSIDQGRCYCSNPMTLYRVYVAEYNSHTVPCR